MPSVGFEATNLFAAAAQFFASASESKTISDQSNMKDAVGNIECETMINGRTEYRNTFNYCNAAPAIGTDLATLLTKFGDVHDSKKVTELTVTFKAGEYAVVEIVGHNHDANAHAAGTTDGYADASALIPSGAGFGVPTWTGQNAGSNSSAIEATLRLFCTHHDRVGAAGTHFVGNSITFGAELTIKWVGVPTVALPTGWTQDDVPTGDHSEDFDEHTIRCHKWLDRAA